MATTCDKKPYVTQPDLVACLALWHTLELCKDLGFDKVILEGDAQVLLNVDNSEGEDLSYLGHIIEDIKGVLRGRSEWRVQYTH